MEWKTDWQFFTFSPLSHNSQFKFYSIESTACAKGSTVSICAISAPIISEILQFYWELCDSLQFRYLKTRSERQFILIKFKMVKSPSSSNQQSKIKKYQSQKPTYERYWSFRLWKSLTWVKVLRAIWTFPIFPLILSEQQQTSWGRSWWWVNFSWTSTFHWQTGNEKLMISLKLSILSNLKTFQLIIWWRNHRVNYTRRMIHSTDNNPLVI